VRRGTREFKLSIVRRREPLAQWPRMSLTTALVVMSAVLAVTAAQAAGPSPQKAPATTPAPTPDPAPAAQSHPATTTTTDLSSPAPMRTPASTPTVQPSVATPSTRASARRPRVRPRTAATRRHRTRIHAHHRLAAARHTSPVTRPAAPVAVRHAAARPAPAHNHGVVLALGALVLGLLVAASLWLLRVARRLQREIMGSVA
jgi:hypothetical protein